jgi:hypothetical protein
MAPEEILGSADASRRNFLKKVLAGTTFAMPVLASFSTEGLSPESALAAAESNQCSNQFTSPCCEFAGDIAQEIALLASFVAGLQGAALPFLKPLAKALTTMAEGVEKGQGLCTNKPALDHFKKARKELDKFKAIVDELCDDTLRGRLFKERADTIIEHITDLLDGDCTGLVPV